MEELHEKRGISEPVAAWSRGSARTAWSRDRVPHQSSTRRDEFFILEPFDARADAPYRDHRDAQEKRNDSSRDHISRNKNLDTSPGARHRQRLEYARISQERELAGARRPRADVGARRRLGQEAERARSGSRGLERPIASERAWTRSARARALHRGAGDRPAPASSSPAARAIAVAGRRSSSRGQAAGDRRAPGRDQDEGITARDPACSARSFDSRWPNPMAEASGSGHGCKIPARGEGRGRHALNKAPTAHAEARRRQCAASLEKMEAHPRVGEAHGKLGASHPA